jgi:predicted NAD/FAD-binding protein
MKIAIIGGGISGLVTAYLLSGEHDITLFEANDYLGGHTHTVDVPQEEKNLAVDTGFIVFNERTYPNFIALLARLGVASQLSDMSFSVADKRTGLEYRATNLNTLFAQRSNLINIPFWRMLQEIFRFRKETLSLYGNSDFSKTLGDYLTANTYSRMFIDEFIVPMGSAIWSADPKQEHQGVCLTYWMNLLQSLETDKTFCVTLNTPEAIRPESVIQSFVYHHPSYSTAAFEAQKRRSEISGVNRTWYCGAYWGYGFHEDGVKSALAVCKPFGKELV